MQDVVQVELADWTQRRDNNLSVKSTTLSSKKSGVNPSSRDTLNEGIGRDSALSSSATSSNDVSVHDEKKVITKTIR